MSSQSRPPRARMVLVPLLALIGFLAAVIIIVNLHIFVGLEEGYAASPAQVWEWSPILGAIDLALLVAGPVLGVLAVSRRRNPTNTTGGDRVSQ